MNKLTLDEMKQLESGGGEGGVEITINIGKKAICYLTKNIKIMYYKTNSEPKIIGMNRGHITQPLTIIILATD